MKCKTKNEISAIFLTFINFIYLLQEKLEIYRNLFSFLISDDNFEFRFFVLNFNFAAQCRFFHEIVEKMVSLPSLANFIIMGVINSILAETKFRPKKQNLGRKIKIQAEISNIRPINRKLPEKSKLGIFFCLTLHSILSSVH